MMRTPTSATIPQDPSPAPKRNSYLDEFDYGFAAAAPAPHGHSYHDPYSSLGLSDPSRQHAPDYPPPPPQDEAYDLGQQNLASRAHSDVGSSTTLSPDDSASALGRSDQQPYGSYPYQQQQPQQGQSSILSLVPEAEQAGSPYQPQHHRPLSYNERAGLVDGAEGFAGHLQGRQDRYYAHGGLPAEQDEDAWDGKSMRFNDLEISDDYSHDRSIRDQPTFADLTWRERVLESLGIGSDKRFPVEVRIENRRRGIGRQRRPWVTWALCVAMVAVFVYELVRNHALTGSVIATKPTFNWMIGPSSAVLTNIGARFVPCMKPVTDAPLTYPVACFNETRSSIPTSEACTLASYCGLNVTDTPDQTWRFFTPIFMHAGVVHILLNVVVLWAAGGQIEKEVGSLSYTIIFFAGAIFGFEFGGNFALPAVPSVGASGGIFAVNAVAIVDLGLHWKLEARPGLKLFFVLLELAVCIGLGFIPFVIDNWSHLGGLLQGLLWGIILYPALALSKRAKVVVWVMRAAALVLIVVGFVLISVNFARKDSNASCEWCRYLSCIPVAATNYCKGTGLPAITNSSRRSLFDL